MTSHSGHRFMSMLQTQGAETDRREWRGRGSGERRLIKSMCLMRGGWSAPGLIPAPLCVYGGGGEWKGGVV